MNTMSWSEQSACKSSPVALSDFFTGTPSDEVKAVCESCPVRQECYDYALVNESYGYWGGATEQERYAARVSLGISHPAHHTFLTIASKVKETPITHGTAKGYQQHRRKNVSFTDECGCLEAHRQMVRDHRAAKKEAQAS